MLGLVTSNGRERFSVEFSHRRTVALIDELQGIVVPSNGITHGAAKGHETEDPIRSVTSHEMGRRARPIATGRLRDCRGGAFPCEHAYAREVGRARAGLLPMHGSAFGDCANRD